MKIELASPGASHPRDGERFELNVETRTIRLPKPVRPSLTWADVKDDDLSRSAIETETWVYWRMNPEGIAIFVPEEQMARMYRRR